MLAAVLTQFHVPQSLEMASTHSREASDETEEPLISPISDALSVHHGAMDMSEA